MSNPTRKLGPRRDAAPEIPTAGLQVLIHGNAKECMDHGERKPYQKRSLADPIQHLPGKLPSNVLSVSEKARSLTHGVNQSAEEKIKEVIYPLNGTHPLLEEQERLKEAKFNRVDFKPLGRGISTGAKFPDYVHDPEYRFGVITEYDDAKPVIYPGYTAGDSKDKKEKEKPDYPAGMKIEHSNDGAMVKEAILWEEERVKQHKTKLVTKLLDDFNELRKPQIARVCDPIKDTLKVTPAHTFGLVLPPDDYDARDLIRQRPLREAKKALKQKRQHQDEQSSEAEPSPPPQQEQPKQFQRGRQVPAEGRRSPRRQGTRNPVEEEIEDEGEVEEGEEALTDKITSLPPGGLLDGSKKRNPAEMPAFGAPTIRIGTRPLMQKLADSKNYGDQFNAKALLAPTARNLYGRERITRMVQHLFESHDGPTTSAPNDPSPLSIREFQAPADDPAALIDRRFRREKLSVKDLLEPFAEKKDELRKTQHEWVFV